MDPLDSQEHSELLFTQPPTNVQPQRSTSRPVSAGGASNNWAHVLGADLSEDEEDAVPQEDFPALVMQTPAQKEALKTLQSFKAPSAWLLSPCLVCLH